MSRPDAPDPRDSLELHALFARLHAGDPEAARQAARELARHPDVVVVSACLLGERVRYDGGDKLDQNVVARTQGRSILPLCPEMLAGLGTPRPAIHFAKGDGAALLEGQGAALAVDEQGRDAGAALLRGAAWAAELAALAGARRAILKERSPSCGLLQIHSARGIAPGRGCFAARLVRAGLVVENEQGQKNQP